jgi:predicted nucleotidyltransferase component of viral defense system
MISEGELRRLAAGRRVDPLILDLDYALGWFLAGMYQDRRLASLLRFKGGTCLSKAYFPNYRFSEDLDFTATGRLSADQIEDLAHRVAVWSEEESGPDFRAAPPLLETVSDEYGGETFELRVYFRGPLAWAGSPQAIRLHVTRNERLVLPAEERVLLHPYSDADRLGAPRLACYSLVEMLAEKLRALSGQRRFAIARDVYDVHRLAAAGADLAILAEVLRQKLEAKGMALEAVTPARLAARRGEFERNWQDHLAYLLPRGQEVAFSDAWATAIDLLQGVGGALRGRV